jgi:hypothetical protein
MAVARTPQQVARRAVILSAISFRSSLEVTDHPRVNEICQRLLPWLIETDCEDEIDPIERELLQTPLRQLSGAQKTDANWSGEAAAFFCWTLNLSPPLKETQHADPSILTEILHILQPQASQIIRFASLRDRAEIEDTCRHFVLIRSMLQESRVQPPACDVIRRMHVRRLNQVGLAVTEDAVLRASESVNRMTPEDRHEMAGAYFVRDHAAFWFLSDRQRYFEQHDPRVDSSP